jgi:formylglycine-generating enzyme required for sulfatase activity
LINVVWNDAREYATWLSRKTGKSYRLPTEAEWEYSARAGTTTPFATGATISTDQANYDGNVIYGNGRQGVHRRKTVDVGSFLANAFGLHDMHGNVWEWVADCHKERRAAAPERDTRPMHVVPVADRPTGLRIAPPEACAARVVRGGSWSDGPALLRSAARFGLGPDSRLPNSGFRVARSLSQ